MGVVLNEDEIETNRVELVTYIKPDNTTGFRFHTTGGSNAILIGYLTVMLDKMRHDEIQTWDDDD